LQTVANEVDFNVVRSCLPALIDGFYMLWVISQFYCAEEKMVGLMNRIAVTLCEKVVTVLDVATLFK